MQYNIIHKYTVSTCTKEKHTILVIIVNFCVFTRDDSIIVSNTKLMHANHDFIAITYACTEEVRHKLCQGRRMLVVDVISELSDLSMTEPLITMWTDKVGIVRPQLLISAFWYN